MGEPANGYARGRSSHGVGGLSLSGNGWTAAMFRVAGSDSVLHPRGASLPMRSLTPIGFDPLQRRAGRTTEDAIARLLAQPREHDLELHGRAAA